MKNFLLGRLLIFIIFLTSCKKTDVFPIQSEDVDIDLLKSDTTEDQKSKIYNLVESVGRINRSSENSVKIQKKKIKKLSKIKKFIKVLNIR